VYIGYCRVWTETAKYERICKEVRVSEMSVLLLLLLCIS
jgi:hypothetical protein